MSQRVRIFVVLALVMPVLVPVTVAQKPPAPAPPPRPSTPPSAPTNSPFPPPTSEPIQPGDLVMFLRGRVATDDGTPVPSDVLVERFCNNRVRQQSYASPHGDFSMQLGSKADSFPDTSGDPTSQFGVADKDSDKGISRRELRNCELRASSFGFHDGVVSLAELDTFGSNVDVGVVVVQRVTKIEGTTLSAIPYKAPKDARRAYEKGLDAEKKGKLADARKYFETAVEVYPKFTNAWFHLGTVLEKGNQKDAARTAYTQAATIDNKFLPPYLSLASMAYQAENWTEVLGFTGHILDLDPLNHTAITGYLLDLDLLNCADAYFYNAVANYKLNKVEEAERSALKAERIAPLTHFPQLHLILAEIFARKNDYPTAISEMQTYLELAPHAKNADQVRAHLAELEKLNGSASTSEKPDHM
jgi:tetratricopeptide (TPR) repeat protein